MKPLVTAISIFFSLFFAMDAWTTELPVPLVQVYCDSLMQKLHPTKETSVLGQPENETAQWNALVARFESRTGNPEIRNLDPDAYDRCLSENRPQFEEGEFALEGKKLLQVLEVAKKTAPIVNSSTTPDASSEAIESDGSATPDVLTGWHLADLVAVKPRLGTTAPVEENRALVYDGLWKSFLARIKLIYGPRRAAATFGLVR